MGDPRRGASEEERNFAKFDALKTALSILESGARDNARRYLERNFITPDDLDPGKNPWLANAVRTQLRESPAYSDLFSVAAELPRPAQEAPVPEAAPSARPAAPAREARAQAAAAQPERFAPGLRHVVDEVIALYDTPGIGRAQFAERLAALDKATNGQVAAAKVVLRSPDLLAQMGHAGKKFDTGWLQ